MQTIINYSNNEDGSRCGYYFMHKGKKYSDIDDAKNIKSLIRSMVKLVCTLHGGRPMYKIVEVSWKELLKRI